MHDDPIRHLACACLLLGCMAANAVATAAAAATSAMAVASTTATASTTAATAADAPDPAAPATIHEAARAGDLDRLREILSGTPAALEDRDADAMTPLHHAVEGGQLAVARFLLDRGADLEARDAWERTPLQVAARTSHAAVTSLLLERGADVGARDMLDRTALFVACNWGKDLETVRLLIDAGADLDGVNARGEHVLVYTLAYGERAIVDLLVERGARIPDDPGLISRATYLSAASGFEHVFVQATAMCEERQMAWWEQVSMDAVARGGSVAIGEALLAKGVALDEQDRYGIAPLHVAAECGNADFVAFLLDRGARIDTPSVMGKTALHLARDAGRDEVAALLLARGARDVPPVFPELRGPYMGQTPPGGTPERFATGIVSTHGFDSEHSPVVFSPDGTEAYWTLKFKGPILFSRQVDGVWTAPAAAPFCSESGDGEPIFAPDGQRLYFLSLRPLEPGGSAEKERIWYVERAGDGWAEARPVSAAVNDHDLHWLFSLAADGTLYFSSTRADGHGKRDLYRARCVDGVHQEAENLGPVINSGAYEHTPFVAPDQSYLIFSVIDLEGAGRAPGLYISYRDEVGAWTPPIRLGEEINAVELALCPAVTPDGRYMTFIGMGDIWWVDAGFIEALRPVALDGGS